MQFIVLYSLSRCRGKGEIDKMEEKVESCKNSLQIMKYFVSCVNIWLVVEVESQ